MYTRLKILILALAIPASIITHASEKDEDNYVDENGLKQGWHYQYYENGQLKIKTHWVDGVENGGEEGYYKNGNVKYNIVWKDGAPEGYYQIYYQTGEIKETGYWRNDLNVGDQTEYYRNGTVKTRSTHNSEGDLEGAQINYYPNELIQSIAVYERGVKNGFEIELDSTGSLEPADMVVRNWVNGKKESYPLGSGALLGMVQYVKNQNQLIFTRDSLAEAQKQAHDAQVAAEAEADRKGLELKAEQTQRIYLYAGLGLLLTFGIFMWNRFRVTHRQKGIIEEQKAEVDEQKAIIEESHKEITDSIVYAKRIQKAILPPNKFVSEYLANSFILYKPKDVIAGDFYWMESSAKASASEGDIGGVLFAAADCTGHGVPGAMVSVVCNNGLNRSVREYGLTDPGAILDKTREIVIEEFDKSEEDVKDGMDIALVSLAGSEESGARSLKYAGAHNPLWIVRNGEVLETKADKQPIGKFHQLTPYTTHTIELQKNDTIYIFSDGYPDQFGGDKGKKFKSKAFKELLISIQDQSMEEQRESLNQAFEEWRGAYEQIDDICVIGVRV